MKKRFSEEQIIGFLREAEARSGHSRRLTVEISAIVRNSGTGFVVSVRTGSASQSLAIPPKSSG